MQGRTPTPLPAHVHPVDPWRLVERRLLREYLPRTESLFAVGNGYLGLRGNPEEGRPAHEHGTIVNGLHESWEIHHAEEAYGFAQHGQTLVEAPDAKIIKLYVDDEPLQVATAHLLSYERVLDMRRGVLHRELVWETPAGKQVRVRSERFVSLRHRHLAAISYEVCILNADAPVTISSQILNRQDTKRPDLGINEGFDPRVARGFTDRVFHGDTSVVGDSRIIMGYRTAHSRMTLGCGIDHIIETDNEVITDTETITDQGKVVLTVRAKAGQPTRLVKFAAYHSSGEASVSELRDRTGRTLDRAVAVGWDALAADQEADTARFWDRADVVVEGDERAQQAIRWSLFQLLCASERADGAGIPAKGVSGLGYEGHYFWDIEVYVMPFLCYTEPRLARNLIRFRHSMLDAARARARELGHRGALYPWRTITGEEASAYYQAGTAQYHLNADIVYALKQYVQTTGDVTTLRELGAEMLIETARLWVDLGFFDADGQFHLHGVTGPDEYTTVVDNNAYTNMMAAMNLHYAAEVIGEMEADDNNGFRYLAEKVGLEHAEVESWRAAAKAMHLPFDAKRRIHPQDEHFLSRKRWPFEDTPANRYPLLLHYHPLVIYRHQVIKQADIVLAMFLLGDRFSPEQKQRNFEYYEPLTTSDSSLSPSVHAIVAAEVGAHDKAIEHFGYSLYMDLDDVGGNADHGVHVAATGGTWMALVYGFGGLRDHEGAISFDPRLPEGWDRLAFPLAIRSQVIHVEVTRDLLTLHLTEGDGLDVSVRGEAVRLTEGAPQRIALRNGGFDG